MTTKLTTTLKIDNWDENPTQENDDGTKLTRAVVTLTEGADGLKSGRFESLMHYKTDGTAAYVTVMRVDAVSHSIDRPWNSAAVAIPVQKRFVRRTQAAD